MEKGIYSRRRVDFSKYAASFFTPHIFAGTQRTRLGCGACTLALLTGATPELVAKRNGRAHYADNFMVRFLREHDHTVLPLTLCSVSASRAPLGEQHVILLSQLFRRNEATWGVIFNNSYYHNFQIFSLDLLSFLNKPILSAYVVLHPSWNPPTRPVSNRVATRKLRRKSVPFSSLKIAGQSFGVIY